MSLPLGSRAALGGLSSMIAYLTPGPEILSHTVNPFILHADLTSDHQALSR